MIRYHHPPKPKSPIIRAITHCLVSSCITHLSPKLSPIFFALLYFVNARPKFPTFTLTFSGPFLSHVVFLSIHLITLNLAKKVVHLKTPEQKKLNLR